MLFLLRNKAKYRTQVVKKQCTFEPGLLVFLGGGSRLVGKGTSGQKDDQDNIKVSLLLLAPRLVWEGVPCLSS